MVRSTSWDEGSGGGGGGFITAHYTKTMNGTSENVTITSVDTAKSYIVLHQEMGSGSTVDKQVKAEFTSATNVNLTAAVYSINNVAFTVVTSN